MENKRAKYTILFYRQKFETKLAEYNHSFELPHYFGQMIGDKKEVTIAELAAGPICTIGSSWKDVKVNIHASDVLEKDYATLWQQCNTEPVVKIEYQDMERLTYPDNFFDIVHCVNALDHTLDVRSALREMLRVCKQGGWIYLRHKPDQRKKWHGMHEWDMNVVDEETIFSNPTETFSLKEFGDFKTHTEGPRNRTRIISILHKN